jgi:nucleotide-binding universal stress UspA family protein
MKTILVALDKSPVAPHVLAEASAMARASGAKLILFRAVSVPTELPAEVFIEPPDRVAEIILARARRELGELTIAVPPELLGAVKVRVGVAWQAICDTAKDEKVDLIVIGSHGYRGLDRLLGTTAAKVVNHADRSVLVVRPPTA